MRKKSFKAESKRLLDLMIHSIYTHKEIFLREIISNASDALDKLHFVSLTDENARKYAENLAIEIMVDKEKRTLQVSDNGIGMTDKELEENLGTIAKSGSFQFKNDLDEKDKADIIGQFGVGFYSAFMVSDNVTVQTRRYDSDTAYCWSSNGADGYTIEECQKDTPGTDVIMHIKEDTEDEHYSEYLENYRLRDLVKTYSDYIRYPIIMDVEKSQNMAKEGEEPKYETVVQRQTVNSMVPIWQRSKKRYPTRLAQTIIQSILWTDSRRFLLYALAQRDWYRTRPCFLYRPCYRMVTIQKNLKKACNYIPAVY